MVRWRPVKAGRHQKTKKYAASIFRHRKKENNDYKKVKKRSRIKLHRIRLKREEKKFKLLRPLVRKRLKEILQEERAIDRNNQPMLQTGQTRIRFRLTSMPSSTQVTRAIFCGKILGLDQAIFELTNIHIISRNRLTFYTDTFTSVKDRLLKSQSGELQAQADNIQDAFENEKLIFKRQANAQLKA